MDVFRATVESKIQYAAPAWSGLLGIETDLTRFFVDVLSWVTETSPHHILKTSLETVMKGYFKRLTLTASIYCSSTCLNDPVLVTLSDRGDTTKHL